ncbi:Acetylornithine deacetylase/Succinyl-diaminopimelate desuccinylase [Bryocella elongata]|uniref:Acetylornithine deacetylase/Succinyl-diaminopimelate desuccinylase n=1 Tax=Bryocella elongata TaxID=863522 RepID=A0A1H5XVI8_9BACT|nr:Acetylornithine deacetylase/Succinyl-diaminopimelate desuccinylase [Bryocella elongata]
MRHRYLAACLIAATGLSGCTKEKAKSVASAPVHKLGIRPYGDETVKIDTSKMPAEEKKAFDYIDAHIDEHVENLQKWIQQPSISNSGEGMQESPEMVKGFFDKLGCQKTQINDVGITKWGQPGNPVVYAECNEGAPKTLLVYWMYDTMPVTQPELWVAPPFEARLVDGKTAGIDPGFKKVLIGRGAVNSKGPEMTQWNAFQAIKAANGKLPVNLIVIAEGDEERMSMGLNKFVTTHPDLLKRADAMLMFGGQNGARAASIMGASEGLMYIELTTSGTAWGRGPTVSDIHGIFKRSTDSPAWRHILMLGSLIGKDGNTPTIPGFMDNIKPIDPATDKRLHEAAGKVDLKKMADNVGVARFISDDPYTVLKMSSFGTAFNLDGIWGGNMYAGGSGAILPNKITSKHSIRYVPDMNSGDILKKIRARLDSQGYKDVQLRLIGDQPWSSMDFDTDVAHSVEQMFDKFGIPWTPPLSKTTTMDAEDTNMGGAWPGYLFTNGKQGDPGTTPIGLPIAGGSAGYGGRAHAANEFWVIEGSGKVYGMAGAEKSIVDELYNFANNNTTPAKHGLK